MSLLELAHSAPWATHLVLVIWLAICSVQDGRKREVSNWLTLPPFVLGLLYALGSGGETLVLTLITLVVFVGARAFWKAQGAADIKVLVMLAAFWPQALFAALMVTAIWSVIRIVGGQGKEAYAGLPPIAIGSFLVLILFDLFPHLKILFPV